MQDINRIYPEHEILHTAVSVLRTRDQVISDPGLLTPGPGKRILVFDVTVIFRTVYFVKERLIGACCVCV